LAYTKKLVALSLGSLMTNIAVRLSPNCVASQIAQQSRWAGSEISGQLAHHGAGIQIQVGLERVAELPQRAIEPVSGESYVICMYGGVGHVFIAVKSVEKARSLFNQGRGEAQRTYMRQRGVWLVDSFKRCFVLEICSAEPAALVATGLEDVGFVERDGVANGGFRHAYDCLPASLRERGDAVHSDGLLCQARHLWQRHVTVNVIKGDVQTLGFRKLNDFSSYVRQNGLPLLVVAHVALRAAEPFTKSCLGQSKSRADGFDVVHA